MSQQELVIKVVRVLEGAGIQYMATGSFVSSLQGEPRATHDFDVVIAIDKSQIHAVLAAFPPPDYYIDEKSIEEAIESKGAFNLIDIIGGDKVDFWLLTDDPYDKKRFTRAILQTVFGYRIRVSTPEDTILMKLRWSQLSGGSKKQFDDALGVYEVQSVNLDINYIRSWAAKLGIVDLWSRLTNEARPF